jgi:ribosomal protein S18 acetylase RimI-like enzyme
VQVALRPAQDGDEPFLLRVYAETREQELARVDWSAERKDAFVKMQFAAQTAHYAQYGGLSIDIVLVDGEAAGRLLVARWTDEIRIVDIALLANFRGRGAGGELLGALIAEAAVSARRLSIHVERESRALGLYERLGFRTAGERGPYLRMQLDPAAEGPQGQVKIAS